MTPPAFRQFDVSLDATVSRGVGVVVAEPSKTADIEQSLVIGAHGPREFTLLSFGED